jgi:opacity protein-like surface antigen
MMFKRNYLAILFSVLTCVVFFPLAAHAASPLRYDWGGAYIGANIGWSTGSGAGNAGSCDSITNILGKYGNWQFANLCDAFAAGHASGNTLDFDGCGCSPYDDNAYWLEHRDRNAGDSFALGVQAGRNWQTGDFVRGVEGDIRYFGGLTQTSDQAFRYYEDFNGDWDGDFYAHSSSSVRWLTTFRGRVGRAMGPQGRLLTYGTAGVALAVVSADMKTAAELDGNVDWCDACTFSNPRGTGTFVQPGIVMGAGVEYALTDRLSLGVEYLFTALGNTRTVTTHFSGDNGRGFDLSRKVGFDDIQTVSLKLNFKF